MTKQEFILLHEVWVALGSVKTCLMQESDRQLTRHAYKTLWHLLSTHDGVSDSIDGAMFRLDVTEKELQAGNERVNDLAYPRPARPGQS